MPFDILVVGSAAIDLVIRSERFARSGETLIGGEFASYPGGKGANQAVAIARLRGGVAFVGCVGSDDFGDRILASLEGSGVDTRFVSRTTKAASGIASIVVDAEGRNQIIVAPGSNLLVTPDQVRAAMAESPDAWVLAQLEIPLETVLEASHARRFVLNPAPGRALPDELLRRCYALTPNETEAQAVTGVLPEDENSCKEAAAQMLSRGAANTVITLGERGCFWTNGSAALLVPPPLVEPVDTVAAGDAFSGALTLGLARGEDWPSALGFANRVAAISTTRHGAQTSMPTAHEVSE